MKLKKYLIAGGNSTLIARDASEEEKSSVIEKYLGEVEQIGFASVDKDGTPSFTMMGGEFSGNGTTAFASTLQNEGNLKTSGVYELVHYQNTEGKTTITVPIKYSREGDVVLLEGIGYLCVDHDMEVDKDLLDGFCQKYNLPAFGVAVCIDGKLTPYVYVKDTNSLVKETACGSGSIAASIFSGLENITQPSAEIIEVKRTDNKFSLTARVTEI